jgi:cytochrome c-type biogenesis protein CcmH
MRPTVFIGLAIVAIGALIAAALLAPTGATTQPGAKALEAVLLAPCCWGGTLETHESDIAAQLRTEIESRVARGESTTAIEADLVQRYGPQIRAMPHEKAFSSVLALAAVAVVVAGAGVGGLIRSWRQGGVAPQATASASQAPARDAYDDRLDAELEDID